MGMRSSSGCTRRCALSYGRRANIGRGGDTGRGGCTDRGRRRRPHPWPETKPSAGLGHAWIREEIEMVERFFSSGKGMK